MLIQTPKKLLYSGTISGLRISAVNEKAFFDNCAALVPFADGTNEVTAYHTNGAFIRAVLKAQGSGETLGANLFHLANLNLTSGWTTGGTGSIVDADSYLTTGSGGVYRANMTTDGVLYKGEWSGSTTNGDVRVTEPGVRYDYVPRGAFGSGYATSYLNTAIYLVNASAGQTDISEISLKQVLTPSADGVILQASKWDATENFGYKNSGFVYNAASYFVQVRKVRG